MKKVFLRGKAVLQITLLLIAIFYFSYAIKPVEAASDVCCEKTISEQYCFYGDSSNCDPAYQYAAVGCEQTSFCKIGCCYDLDEGMCYRSVPQSKCLSAEGGEWYTDETCNSVGVCQPGCCVIGSQCQFTTEQSCALETAKHPELDLIFHSNILTESECQDICRAKDKGCCINRDDSCVYKTREACDVAKGDFYNEQYCSDIALCGCSEHHDKTCYDDDVYWVDSCSNMEEIAEDCDYAQGTLCRDVNGEKTCGSVNCDNTYSDEKNKHDSNIGGFRKNGESWCVYESPVGNGLDRPGTRHYKHMCVNGEEIVESCRDLREEICIQGEQGGMTEANCVYNDIYDSPVTPQVSSVPKGQTLTCSEADSDCPVVWTKKGRGSWKCSNNCECEQADYIKQMADYCKFMGDCGADFNVAGKYTDDGFSITSVGRTGPPRRLLESQTQEWNKYGVYGGMIGLYAKILDYIEDILESGTEAATAAKEAQDDLKQKGMYGMLGTAVAGYMVSTAAFMVGAVVTSTTVATSGLATSWMLVGQVGTFCWFCAVVVVAIIIIVYILTDMDVETKHVMTTCSEWQAPTGGSDCDKCLDQKKVDELGFYDTCTEYKCKSLGLNCQYIPENAGTERVACFNSAPNDVNSPIISPWEEALTQGFSIQPIAQGYEIIDEVPYYNIITFGIKTNELSQCKISQEHTDSYNSMVPYFGDSFYQLEHSITMNPQVGGQTYDYYVRCQDPSGNPTPAEYVIRFTTKDEPDRMSPSIEGTSIDDYGYAKAGTSETALDLYVNEPANCKWSLTDQKYDEMENTIYCEDMPNNVLGYEAYPCYTTLNLEEGMNTYYFRCEDKSENKNQNQQGWPFHLTSTDELTIASQGPEGTLLDTVSPTLTVTTSGGAENGKATCYFTDKKTIDISLWPEFYETGATMHSQQLLSLAQGEHNYYTSCEDIALNEANTTITFIIDKDVKAPEIEHIYIDTVALHIILDEPSTCEYSNETFSFGEGSMMSGAGTTHNTVSIAGNYYYVNCEDTYNNNWGDPIIVFL